MYNQHQQYNYTLFTIDTKLVGVNTPLGHPQIKCDRPACVLLSPSMSVSVRVSPRVYVFVRVCTRVSEFVRECPCMAV